MERRILLAAIIALGACNEGDNQLPTVLLTEPSGDRTVSRGGTLAISYTDDDPLDEASTSLYFEAPLAGGGPYLIAADRPELDGILQVVTFRWDPGTIPAGTYRVVAVTSDGSGEPVVAAATGLVTLASVSRARGDGGDDRDTALAVSTLPDGSAFVTGLCNGTSVFGEGETGETTLTSAFDLFIARYRPDGTLAWAKRAGGDRVDQGQAIAAFPDGSCVVTGRFDSTATFGAGEANETMLTALDDNPQSMVLGGREIFVARYNPDGTLAWAKSVRGPWFDEGTGVAALPDGSSIVSGWFQTTVTFGAGETNETVLVSENDSSDIFVARYNANGTLAWARRAGGAMSDNGLGISALPDGTSFVSGYFSATATFGPGEAGQRILTAAVGLNAFVACYEPDGRLRWVARATGEDSVAYAIGVAPDGSTVVTGRLRADATFGDGEANETTLTTDPGNEEIFVARYDSLGTLLWAKRAGGAGIGTEQGRAIAALPDGSAVVTGQLGGAPATFGPGEAGETVIPGGAFVARYGPDGTLAWAKQAAAPLVVAGSGVAVLPDESVFVVGFFTQEVTFGPGEPNETTLTWVPGDDETADSDLFLALYNADGSF